MCSIPSGLSYLIVVQVNFCFLVASIFNQPFTNFKYKFFSFLAPKTYSFHSKNSQLNICRCIIHGRLIYIRRSYDICGLKAFYLSPSLADLSRDRMVENPLSIGPLVVWFYVGMFILAKALFKTVI